ncbi:ABC transporter ATP-binding protein [Nostocoides sp.]|uniref:ABC transporter ATP-binding protein n=1 Tax=Nostocoides sp. TaxID=1917966 RepID=UPI003BB17D28
MRETSVIAATGLRRTYPAQPPVPVLHGVDLVVRRGERVAVLGGSGAGKSTLLNILGLLDPPDGGSYVLLETQVTTLNHRERDRLRATALGFVFQAHHVLGHRTASENVALKLATIAAPRRERADRIHAALAGVGLGHRAAALGRTLSGGEKQRLAIARAVVGNPAVLLADEPTGNLDDDNTANVLNLLAAQASAGVAVVVITHDRRVARWADTAYTLSDGALEVGAG